MVNNLDTLLQHYHYVILISREHGVNRRGIIQQYNIAKESGVECVAANSALLDLVAQPPIRFPDGSSRAIPYFARVSNIIQGSEAFQG